MRKGLMSLRIICAFLSLSVAIPLVHVNCVKAFTVRNLMFGSQGYDVNELQGRLRLLGYYWGKTDGKFDWQTYWAVRTFQYNFGLKVTGDVDMETKMKLVRATPNWHATGPTSEAPSSGSGAGSTGSTTGNSSGNSSGTAFPESSIQGLSQSDLNLMAHVVYGEARGEQFEGQVAIAAVILNRIHSSKFPKTVPSIVYAPGAFSAVDDGQVNLTPNSEAKDAVMKAISGWDPTHGATFYFNPAKTSNAFMWSRPEIIQIGNHIFTT